MAQIVHIRRQPSSWRIASVKIELMSGLRWDYITGGVGICSHRPIVVGYVYCDQIVGDFDHTCEHGPPPHKIKVVLVKKDNKAIWSEIEKIIGPKP